MTQNCDWFNDFFSGFNTTVYADPALNEVDNKIQLETPGANPQNMSIDSSNNKLTLEWSLGQKKKTRCYTWLLENREIEKAVIKDGITTLHLKDRTVKNKIPIE